MNVQCEHRDPPEEGQPEGGGYRCTRPTGHAGDHFTTATGVAYWRFSRSSSDDSRQRYGYLRTKVLSGHRLSAEETEWLVGHADSLWEAFSSEQDKVARANDLIERAERWIDARRV